MTLLFTSNEITIYRKRRKAGTDRFVISATLTGYSVDIQPASPERVQLAEGRFGATFTAFIEASVDIREGDQIRVVDTGKVYSVKGVENWQAVGLLEHKELTLVSQDG